MLILISFAMSVVLFVLLVIVLLLIVLKLMAGVIPYGRSVFPTSAQRASWFMSRASSAFVTSVRRKLVAWNFSTLLSSLTKQNS